VARELAAASRVPGSGGRAELVLHMGDVVYMTGERRLYDRNFRRPYADFLTEDSRFDRFTFRLPFLPVPGNHDYYDFPAWAGALVRTPVLGAGLRAVARELFAFSLPEGGSDMGRAFMEAFVNGTERHATPALRYEPGRDTRLPNRYYRFRFGTVDFFALDSNTLGAPLPGDAADAARASATRNLANLRAEAEALDAELRREQGRLERWRAQERERLAEDPASRAEVAGLAADVIAALERGRAALAALPAPSRARVVARALRHWRRAHAGLTRARGARARAAAVARLEQAGQDVDLARRALEESLVDLAEGAARTALVDGVASIEAARERWTLRLAQDPPQELCDHIAKLSEATLQTQRGIASDGLRARYRPEDYDAAQLQWLERSLRESERERPQQWRIVYLHHPLFTTTTAYCENDEVRGIRASLVPMLNGRVHAVFSGHAHSFEWLRSDRLSDTALFVTGGGGQVTLNRSVLDPARHERHLERYRALREAGVTEATVAGRGPRATDGEDGFLYHFLSVVVTPETITVRPIGVRRIAGGYRRETPMPVHHVAALPAVRPPWETRRLEAVVLRRGAPPRPVWA